MYDWCRKVAPCCKLIRFQSEATHDIVVREASAFGCGLVFYFASSLVMVMQTFVMIGYFDCSGFGVGLPIENCPTIRDLPDFITIDWIDFLLFNWNTHLVPFHA